MQIDHPDPQKTQCKHDGCTCAVPSGKEFCSEHCRTAAAGDPTREEDRGACACGHGDCQTNERSAAV